MNRSGDIFPGLLKKFRMNRESLLVLVDNMDLPPGQCRMKSKGSSAGHNGLKSISANLETGEYKRIYIGIGRPDLQTTVVDHVLGDIPEKEKERYTAAYEMCSKALMDLAEFSLGTVINEFNRKKTT